MKRNFILFITILAFTYLHAQKNTISGYVTDATSGETLIGANVYVLNPTRGGTTNTYGFFSLTLEAGSYEVYISYLGYEDRIEKINLNKSITLNVKLNPVTITTKEVVISGRRLDHNIQSADMGVIQMPVEQIKALPVLFGEVDILKTIQLKPGIQSGGEGMSGFYVRGGGPDQNLILLDEAVVYNASHLFGFFSVFNADALQNVEMYKGNMPANYGGRLSSILEISMKEGNNKRYAAQGGIGLIASRLTVEGPIKKDTSSFIISGRRTYIDVFKPFVNKESSFRNSTYYFYDLNAKLNWKLSDKDRLFFSSYFGRDVFDLNRRDMTFSNDISWGNATAVLRWNHLYSSKLFSNISAIYSNYKFSFEALQDQYEMKLNSSIEDWNLKADFTYIQSPEHIIKFGGNYIYHSFIPQSISAKTGDVDLELGDDVFLHSHEAALYVHDEYDINRLFKISAGLRYTHFSFVGPFDRYIHSQATGKIIDTISYGRGENIKSYNNIEPRIGARYLINEVSSVKASFTQSYQYIHLVSMSSVSLPTDVWIPSTDIIKPQFGTQYSIGYFRNFFDNAYEGSIEVFYKDMKNQIEFKEGSLHEEMTQTNLDYILALGDGTSYGLELFLNKSYGNLTGWIGYTWLKTNRIFEDINKGKGFPAKYDRRHDISFVAMYNITDNIKASLVWVYSTGNTATLPVSRYIIEGNIINEYGERNSFRMPSYHRMDVSVVWAPKQKKKRRFTSEWNLSVYNVYNRMNPYYIYFETKGNINDGYMEIKAKQVSLFPLLPSITYNFKF